MKLKSLPRARTALAVLLLVLAGSAWASFQHYQTQRQTLIAAVTRSAHDLGQAVLDELNRAMLQNDRANISRILSVARDVPGVSRILVLGPKGHVYVSSGEPRPGGLIPTEMPGCVECHRLPADALPDTTRMKFLPNELRAATPIPAPLACGSCHAQSSAHLGVVLVDMTLVEVETRARNELWLWLALSVALALSAGGGMLWRLGPRSPKSIIIRAATPAWARQTSRFVGRLRSAAHLTRAWLRPLALVAVALALVLSGSGLFATRVENTNAFCASCHTEPETTYNRRTQAAPVDLASAHAAEDIRCIQCHSGAGMAGRVGAILLGARNVAAFVSGQYHRPAVMLFGLSDAACLKCHADAVTAQTSANHYHFFIAQWQTSAPQTAGTCVACHAAHSTGGSAERGFINQAAVAPVCQQCHALARAP